MILKESLTVEINPSKRILRMPDIICGGISTGTDKIRSGYGNGDCLYFDFDHLVFAVADGSERFPWASRDLLNRLSESLNQNGMPETVSEWKNLINTEIYSEQKYQHKTTFSCVGIRREEEDVLLIIAHGGDSVVTVMNSVTGSICQQTERDMNFAGRSKEIVDVTEYRLVDRDSRVLISTDGFDDVWRFCIRQSLLSGASDVFKRYPLDSICEMIHGILKENKSRFEYDDIGFIILDPFRAEKIKGTSVLMGGTRPHEEKRFQEGFPCGPHDQWISCLRWKEYADIFAKVGIQIKGV